MTAASAYAGADPYPPMTQGSNVPPNVPPNIPLLDPQRMTPKSPRAALEPERVAMPTRRSKRAKHPIVIVGNAIFTIILLITLGVGGVVFWGKQNSKRPVR